jgi:hypothetical protein
MRQAAQNTHMTQTILTEYRALRRGLDYPANSALYYAKQWAEILELERKFDIEIEAEQDDTPIRGNAIASGDDDYDREVENEINARLDRGDVWAWAHVTVRVSYAGITEESNLGGCCYEGEQDFKKGGYYYDMITESVGRIMAQIEDDQTGEH